MSNPCHIEMILTEAAETVAKAEDAVSKKEDGRLNTRQRAARRQRAIAAS
jgi:large subunit ribosomal protein L17e